MHHEYSNVTKEESICKTAQETLNIITDYNRETYKNILQEEYESDRNLINEVSSINLATYLKRKSMHDKTSNKEWNNNPWLAHSSI
jgi:hypothetical protein